MVDSESFILSNSIDRMQEILEEKTEEADFTGYLPGASKSFLLVLRQIDPV